MNIKSIGIVTVNFNSINDTFDLIKSLEKISYKDFSMYIVDNGSNNNEYSKLVDLKKIEILIHPQSLVHAILKFKNGIHKFIFFEPDMSIPIGNAIFGNKFEYENNSKINLGIKSSLEFFKVDKSKFPAINLKPILIKYASIPIILNAANEIFVDEFLKNNISFYSIISNLFELLRDKNLTKYAIKSPSNYESILDIDEWVRRQANEIARKKK